MSVTLDRGGLSDGGGELAATRSDLSDANGDLTTVNSGLSTGDRFPSTAVIAFGQNAAL